MLQQQNPILSIQTHIKNLNQNVDSRISVLRGKIDKLRGELDELEKLNPAQGLASLRDHHKIKGGKVLTQIVIDAVQSPNQNVIKVNAIKKRFMGFVEQPPLAAQPQSCGLPKQELKTELVKH